jgi:crotonobetainyl-CoA:carnitine CoA-transferase CaiB-like acyl-CoA transferase
MSGIGYCVPGSVEDVEKEPPLKASTFEMQMFAGMGAAVATMLAVFARETTGKGQFVDVSALEVPAWGAIFNLANFFYAGMNPIREKVGRRPTAPLHMLPCRDGFIHLECIEEHQWQAFVDLIGNPEWSQNELFENRASRGEYWDALEPLLTEETKQWHKKDLSQAAQARKIPCTVVNEIEDLLSSEQLIARDFFPQIDHPMTGRLPYTGAPFHLSETPWAIKRPAPLLGQHNLDILGGQLGYSPKELSQMRAMAAI